MVRKKMSIGDVSLRDAFARIQRFRSTQRFPLRHTFRRWAELDWSGEPLTSRRTDFLDFLSPRS